MKAVVQNFQTGELSVAEVPPPALQSGGVLVAVQRSVISLGTERAVIEMAHKGPLGKARQRPDLARKVIRKARQEGLWSTYKVVKNLLASPIPLGYSCAGEVLEAGAEADGLRPGERVACFGLSFANHAEVDYVPRNLAVRLPDGLAFEDAAFVGIGAIAMQGVRLAEIELGARVVVLGLGMIGLIAAQLARRAGAQVIATDPDPARRALARSLGAQHVVDDPGALEAAVLDATGGHGADAVLLCAATRSSEPLRTAAAVARLKARVIVVGDVGLELERRPFFEKEIEVVISRSMGPGRFDPAYETRGVDYPLPYVRWTEQRNAASFLELVAAGDVAVAPLVTHRFPIAEAERAYALVTGGRAGGPSGRTDGGTGPAPIAIVLQYEAPPAGGARRAVALRPAATAAPLAEAVRVGVIGAGQFAKGVLLPAFVSAGARIEGVCTSSGLTSRSVGERYGAGFCTSDPEEVLSSERVDAVLVATRHDRHAALVARALELGKAVFCEKPLALDEASLRAVERAVAGAAAPRLLIGFNRRFSPLAARCRAHFAGLTDALMVLCRVNAGSLPADSWVYDPVQGGGRILGEVCHFVDLACFLTGSLPERLHAEPIEVAASPDPHRDSVSIALRMRNGSLAAIHYVTAGDAALAKEYVEVHGGGRSAVLDNYRALTLHKGGRKSRKKLLNQAKGHAEEVAAFVRAVRTGGPMPIAPDELVAVTRATLAIQASLAASGPVDCRSPGEA
jgi:predicted dehydrogenase